MRTRKLIVAAAAALAMLVAAAVAADAAALAAGDCSRTGAVALEEPVLLADAV